MRPDCAKGLLSNYFLHYIENRSINIFSFNVKGDVHMVNIILVQAFCPLKTEMARFPTSVIDGEQRFFRLKLDWITIGIRLSLTSERFGVWNNLMEYCTSEYIKTSNRGIWNQLRAVLCYFL